MGIDETRLAATLARARAAERRAAGLRVRVWRARAGETQEVAGARVGLSRARLAVVEAGGYALDAEVVARLAAAWPEAVAPREEVRVALALVGGAL